MRSVLKVFADVGILLVICEWSELLKRSMMSTLKSVSMLVVMTLSMANAAFGQRYQNNVHFQPPASSLFFNDLDRFEEIKCAISIQTVSGQSRYYDYSLNREKLLQTPKWDPMIDRPGVPLEVAARLATKMLNDIQPFGDCKTSLVELQMQTYWDRWIWVVIFKPKPKDDRIIPSDLFPIIVLMDSTVLKPEDTTPNYLLSDRDPKPR